MAGIVSQQTLEQVRAASDIVDVIGAIVPLRRAGTNFVGLCPFHREKTPSFNVSPAKQMFKCFGCGKGGDVFRFIQDYESVTFPEAIKRLADRAKIPLVFEGGAAPDAAKGFEKDNLLKLHEQICQRWHHTLLNEAAGQVARDYLKKRGVTEEAIKLFRLGAAPDAWDDTVNWSKGKGFDPSLVERGGLIIKREGRDGWYDRFRGRLMFPICDEQGRVIGFSGRVLSGDEKTAKYVNSPETPIFTKGRVMFGLDKSKRAMLDAGYAIICEGQLDLIACYMAGVQNVVAPQGTAFTGQHARILRRYVEEVVLCFDSDNAGQNAAVRALDDLLASGLAIRVAVMPAPHDPDTFIKEHGADAMRKLIQSAPGFFDFYLNRLCQLNDLETDRGRMAVVRELAEAVRKANNAVLTDSVAQKAANRLGVSPDAVRAEFRKPGANRPAAPTEEAIPASAAEPELPPPPVREAWLLRLTLCDDAADHMEWLMAHLDPQWITDGDVRQLVETLVSLRTSDRWRGEAALLAELEIPRQQTLLNDAAMQQRAIPNVAQQLQDVVLQLRNDHYDRELKRLTLLFASPEFDEAARHEALHRRTAVLALKRQPLQPLSDAD